ncbi:MFS transporter [Membranicola marinus]|uniref:MFS transporter n=1 Tax=Membranihabitans marinus TaxID=1227546 RepID=A0A953HJ47_9BACT|nr:MFS transporter [Membranihabitans marinus]MBY5956662.1 MFS transporter [Membranihabitans marinus]
MGKFIKVRLSLLMFLEFFVWGSWYTTVAVYMSQHGMENLTHWPFTGNAIAAIVAPFIVGMVADRYFNSERILGFLHLLGGVILFMTPSFYQTPWLFISALVLYNICFMPTMSLANSLSFHNINDQEKEFPVIRTFGTVGWIVAGLTISFVLGNFISSDLQPEQTAIPVYMAAGFSVLLGLYCFTLPKTPPQAKGEKSTWQEVVGVEALRKLWSQPFAVFLISSILISIPLAAYYNFTQVYLVNTGFKNIAATQTIGQMSEFVFMLLMPLFFVRLGVKRMLAVGMLAWAIRYFLFSAGAVDSVTWMIITGIALHGICYDFFFVTGQIYVDKKADKKIKGQAQGLIVLATYGVGMLIGAQVAGFIFNLYIGDSAQMSLENWKAFWRIPALFALGVMAFFMIFFNDRKVEKKITTT